MKPETKVVLNLERFARNMLRWSRDEIFIFTEHNHIKERERLCTIYGADIYTVQDMEQELIDRRLEKQFNGHFAQS